MSCDEREPGPSATVASRRPAQPNAPAPKGSRHHTVTTPSAPGPAAAPPEDRRARRVNSPQWVPHFTTPHPRRTPDTPVPRSIWRRTARTSAGPPRTPATPPLASARPEHRRRHGAAETTAVTRPGQRAEQAPHFRVTRRLSPSQHAPHFTTPPGPRRATAGAHRTRLHQGAFGVGPPAGPEHRVLPVNSPSRPRTSGSRSTLAEPARPALHHTPAPRRATAGARRTRLRQGAFDAVPPAGPERRALPVVRPGGSGGLPYHQGGVEDERRRFGPDAPHMFVEQAGHRRGHVLDGLADGGEPGAAGDGDV